MSGQSVVDRLNAAKHTVIGSQLGKTVCKATTEEVMGPKRKHLDTLLHYTDEPNVNIHDLADFLIERTDNSNWVVVFKALVTIHHLMNYGNERFLQYFASQSGCLNLGNFLDKSCVTGYDMSTFIRRYSKYLNEKAFSYRTNAFDFCRIKRGKDEGVVRNMSGDKLFKTLFPLGQQLDALLAFDVKANELTNGIINAAFMLLFKDSIRLFACYNEGIISLLEKFFDLNKKNCKEALDLYKSFLERMVAVGKFLKTAEDVGIDKGEIPDMASAPSSLLEALESHLASLEGSKVKKTTPPFIQPPSGTKCPSSAFPKPAAISRMNIPSNELAATERNVRIAEGDETIYQHDQSVLKDTISSNPFAPRIPAPPSPVKQPKRLEALDLFSAPHSTSSFDPFSITTNSATSQPIGPDHQISDATVHPDFLNPQVNATVPSPLFPTNPFASAMIVGNTNLLTASNGADTNSFNMESNIFDSFNEKPETKLFSVTHDSDFFSQDMREKDESSVVTNTTNIFDENDDYDFLCGNTFDWNNDNLSHSAHNQPAKISNLMESKTQMIAPSIQPFIGMTVPSDPSAIGGILPLQMMPAYSSVGSSSLPHQKSLDKTVDFDSAFAVVSAQNTGSSNPADNFGDCASKFTPGTKTEGTACVSSAIADKPFDLDSSLANLAATLDVKGGMNKGFNFHQKQGSGLKTGGANWQPTISHSTLTPQLISGAYPSILPINARSPFQPKIQDPFGF